MVFSFNFKVEDENAENRDKMETDNMNTIKWKEASEIFLTDKHYKRVSELQTIERFDLTDDECEPVNDDKHDTENDNETESSRKETSLSEKKMRSLNFVNSETVSVNLRSNGYTGDLEGALENNTDLVPGVYEGGLKIWECSEDLVKFLYQQYYHELDGCRVLELGCGAGLPGVLAFAAGASVHFNDYNQEVLEEIAIPNVLLNIQSNVDRRKQSFGQKTDEQTESSEGTDEREASTNKDDDNSDTVEAESDDYTETRYFSGDWQHLDSLLTKTNNGEKYDFILTSETIYNSDNHDKLINILKHHLKQEEKEGVTDSRRQGGGVALIAAKSYYFGVGGGIREFQSRLEASGFKVTTVKTFETGVKREILEARIS